MPNVNTKILLDNLDSTTQKFDLHPNQGTVANGQVTFALATSIAGTIDSIDVQTTAGTCDVSIRINNANVVWPSSATVVAASSVINNKVAASANAFGIGAKLTFVVANNSSGANLSISLHCTRTG